MKILIIRSHASTESSHFTGHYYNIQEIGIAKALNRQGYTCDVLFWGKKANDVITLPYGEKEDQTFQVFFRKGVSFLKNAIFFRISHIIRQYDIVHISEYDQIYSWLLAQRYPKKTVIYHGPYFDSFNRRYNLKCKVVDRLFVPAYIRHSIPFLTKSRLAAEYLEKRGIKNITTVGVGFDGEQMNAGAMEESSFTQELYALKENNRRLLLYVGRIEPRRNITFLFEVFAKVYKGNPDTRLVLIGAGEEEYVRSCFDHAEALGIRGAIVYRERLAQNYLPAVYTACEVFLLTTLYEIFGMVLLEAMYFGCIPVSTFNGGADTLVLHGENGLVLSRLDSDVWSRTVLELLLDQERAESLSASASQTVREGYTWDQLVQQFIEVYQKHLSSGT